MNHFIELEKELLYDIEYYNDPDNRRHLSNQDIDKSIKDLEAQITRLELGGDSVKQTIADAVQCIWGLIRYQNKMNKQRYIIPEKVRPCDIDVLV